jgi:hypothetical protein
MQVFSSGIGDDIDDDNRVDDIVSLPEEGFHH